MNCVLLELLPNLAFAQQDCHRLQAAGLPSPGTDRTVRPLRGWELISCLCGLKQFRWTSVSLRTGHRSIRGVYPNPSL